MPDSFFDPNKVDCFAVLDFPALCQQLLACLEHYEGWLIGEEASRDDDRFDEDIERCRAMIEDVRGWCEANGWRGAARDEGRLVKGLRVHDGHEAAP